MAHIGLSSVLTRSVKHRATFQRGVVSCQKCLAPIHVFNTNMIASEFSARCERCHHRGLFLKRSLKIEALPERRKRARG